MAFGILDPHADSVPGTRLLSDKGNQIQTDETRALKRGTGAFAHIVLIPQPSDDPRDPLNWPRWKKETCFWTLVFTTGVAGAQSPLASAAYVELAKEFGVSVDDVTSSFSALFLGFAIFTLMQNALSVKYGHRVVYVLSTCLMFVSCIWTALSPNLVSIRASRVFQGCGGSVPHSLVATTIEHLYFVHERGSRSSTWNFARLAGTVLGPLLNSYVIENMSWRIGFWFFSIACGLALVGVLLFVPETTYHRSTPEHDGGESTSSGTDSIRVEGGVQSRDVDPKMPSLATPTFNLSQLRIYNGTMSDESLWKIFLRPYPFVLSPVSWFIFLAFSVPTLWSALISLCLSAIFTTEYGFDTHQIGLTHLGNLVGILLGVVIAGPLRATDRAIVWMAQRNRGVYEPEYRLVFMLSMLFGVFGYVGWAVGRDREMPWISAVACLAMTSFALVVSGGTAVTYLVDTHGANALHVLSLTNAAMNVLLYSTTFFASGTILAHGVHDTLLIFAACQAACALASVPMYVCGKRARWWIASHPRLFQGDGPVSDMPQPVALAAPLTDPKL